MTDSLTAKPLHGKYFSFLASSGVDNADSTRWLRQHLHSESESTIFAMQDQVIATRINEAKIMCKNVPSLRICDELEETIVHLLTACPLLICITIIWLLKWYIGTFQKFFSLSVSSSSWFTHHPQSVVENTSVKILWDFSLNSKSRHLSNCPDIVLFDYSQKSVLLLEISVQLTLIFKQRRMKSCTNTNRWLVTFTLCTTCLCKSFQL